MHIKGGDGSFKERLRHQSTWEGCFEFIEVIGRGGYSKVWKVYHKPSKSYLALKQMRKTVIVAKRSVHSVLNERRLLSLVKHPFIVNMQYAFQDAENLYLVMSRFPKKTFFPERADWVHR